MADTGGIRAGKAFVELLLRDRGLRAGLKAAQRRLRAFGAGVARIGAGVSAVATAAFAPLGLSAIKAAADAEESLTRFRQVFGTETSAASKFAEDLANRVGRSSLKVKDSLGVFQSFFVGLGFGGPKARELSQQMGALLLDFASFNNLSDEEGLQRFISALSGSSEVLDRFGINIRQAALQQELLRMGIRGSWAEITEQEKALARLNIIARAMGDQGAIGDAVRTSGSWTNRLKALNAELFETRIAIGQALIPVLLPFVKMAINAVAAVREWIQANPRLTATIFGVGAAAIALGGLLLGAGIAISIAGSAMGGLAAVAGVAGTALGFILSPIGNLIVGIAALAAGVVQASGVGGAAVRWLMDRFGELRSFVLDVVKGITDALAAGDVKLAAKVLWLSLKVVWEQGAHALNVVWQSLWGGALAAAELVLHGLEVAWIETTAFLSKIWTNFVGGFQAAWEIASSFVAKRMLEIQGLFDRGLDVKAAKEAVDQQLEAKLGEIGSANIQKNQDLENNRKQERASSAAIHDATMAEIGRRFDESVGSSQAELDAARAALTAAQQKAAEERQTAEANGTDLGSQIRNFVDGIKGLDVAAMADKVSVRGTFNAAAIQGLAAGGPEERTAKATEETAKNTRRIVDQILADNGLTFA